MLDLQEALQQYVRAHALHYMEASRILVEEGGMWPTARDEFSDNAFTAGVRMLHLMERLDDAEGRDLIDRMHTLCTEAMVTDDGRAAMGFHNEAIELTGQANARLGVLIRDSW